MVTSPNWMAPFHIARATADPRAGLVQVGPRTGDRFRMISRGGKPTASRGRAVASTTDDEGVDVEPAATVAHSDLDPVRADRAPRRDVQHPAVHRPGRLLAHRGPVDTVQVDRCGPAGRARRTEER